MMRLSLISWSVPGCFHLKDRWKRTLEEDRAGKEDKGGSSEKKGFGKQFFTTGYKEASFEKGTMGTPSCETR